MTPFMISLFAFLLMLPALPAQSSGKPSPDTIGLINATERKGEMSRNEAMRYKAWLILDNKRLPEKYTEKDATRPVKNATTLLREIKGNWNELSPETKRELSTHLFRDKTGAIRKTALKSIANSTPPLSRGMKTVFIDTTLPNSYQTINFNIEWGDSNLDSTDTSPNNGIPDIVDKWSVYLEQSWTEMVTTMGYTPPLGSNDYLIDVYIANTNGSAFPTLASNQYGYTDTYKGSGIPFMVVNNDYSSIIFYNPDPDGWFIGSMRATAAHEFFHTIHFTIDYWEDAWWMEASATWMEDAVFDETNDYFNYIGPSSYWALNPHASLLLFNNDYHQYGSVIFAKYLSENHGGNAAIKSVWDNCITIQGSSSAKGLKNFFAGRSTSLSEAYQDFAVKNLSMDYEEGINYKRMKIRNTHDAYPLFQSSLDLPQSDPDFLGTNYIEFTPAAGTDMTLTFDGDEYFNGRPVKWGAKIVLSTGSAYSTLDIPLDPTTQGGTQTVTSYSAYSTIYLVTSVVSETGVTPSEKDQTPYNSYPDGVPYAYDACIDCTSPTLPLLEFTNNDAPINGAAGDDGGCFIATAAFGFYSDPHVMILRHFRDRFLLTNDPGRWLVNSYYRFSPPLARLISENGWLKAVTRLLLLPIIATAWLTLDALRLFLSLLFFTCVVKIIDRKKTNRAVTPSLPS